MIGYILSANFFLDQFTLFIQNFGWARPTRPTLQRPHACCVYLSIERAARIQMVLFITSHCPMYISLHGTTPNCHCSCSKSYALGHVPMNMLATSETARDPTKSCVPTCDPPRDGAVTSFYMATGQVYTKCNMSSVCRCTLSPQNVRSEYPRNTSPRCQHVPPSTFRLSSTSVPSSNPVTHCDATEAPPTPRYCRAIRPRIWSTGRPRWHTLSSWYTPRTNIRTSSLPLLSPWRFPPNRSWHQSSSSWPTWP